MFTMLNTMEESERPKSFQEYADRGLVLTPDFCYNMDMNFVVVIPLQKSFRQIQN